MLRVHTAVLAQLLTSCELTARSIEGVYVYSTLGHMSKHAAFTRAPWVERFSVMQCMVHSTTLDPGTGAISREWLLRLLCPKPVTGRNELCLRAIPQGPSWPTGGHLICLPWLFFVLTVFWPSVFGNRVSLNHSMTPSGCWYLWPVDSLGGVSHSQVETIESFKAQDIDEIYLPFPQVWYLTVLPWSFSIQCVSSPES